MRIETSNLFHFVGVETPQDKPPQITLRFAPTGDVVKTTGAVLEAQFATGGRYVLFVTEDVPYEESLHILLIDSDLSVLDSVELSAHYTPGIFENVAIVEPDIIEFSFFDRAEKWRLKIVDTPRRQLWGNKHPVKRHSPFLHKQWLVLQGPDRTLTQGRGWRVR